MKGMVWWELLARCVPKRLVYWCLYRAREHAEKERFSGLLVPDPKFNEIMSRWHAHTWPDDKKWRT